ncbi:MAG: hypothetical protein Q9225_003354 [Loekoesia sp. 1 TL-2023]
MAMVWPSQGIERFLESCRMNGTSQNQSPIDPIRTFGPQLYDIQDIPGKGRGLVAGVQIAKGQRILREQPLFTCSLLWTSYKDFETHLASSISSLSPAEQDVFFSLHNANPESDHPLVARFLTNCLPCQDHQAAAVYSTACLINHSCQANVHGSWNAEARVATVHAVRAIKAGEEITMNYVSGMTHAVREEKLKRLFGISCSCGLCSLPLAAIEKSDAQRSAIQRLFDEVEDMQHIAEQPEQCITKCGQLMKLIEEEYAGCSEHLNMNARVCDAAFRICATHRDSASASVLQKRSYEFRVLIEGSDSPIVKQMKSAIENVVASHKVIIKQAPEHRLDNERQVLQAVSENPCIRPLVDTIKQPSALVLRHLDDNLLDASNAKRLEKADIKFVARNMLTALAALHEKGYVHTDIKPNNILVNYGSGSARFSEVQVGDCGDTCTIDPNADPLEGPIIGAAIFRSPEAMLNLRWRAPTDIWSFGATLISLIWGENWHIFKPANVDVDSKEYPLRVLIKQVSIFGPIPLSYQEIADDERLEILTNTILFISENKLWKPFRLSADKELSKEDRSFICKIMKLDPRDRPTAKQLLQDEWFRGEEIGPDVD